MPAPIAFANPAEVDLKPAPIPAHWITDGTPEARSACLAESADGTCSVMAWSCSAGRFTWRYGGDEMLHVISGEAFVTAENGAVRRLGPGDMVFYPAGSLSSWYVPHYIRKVAVCRHSMPRPCGVLLRAWNRLVDIVTGFSSGELDPALVPKPASKTEAVAPHTGRATAV